MNANAKNKGIFFCKLLLICLLFPLALPYPASALDPDSYEEDSNASQAKLFTLNNVQKHNFHDASDEDWVVFPAISEQPYQIEVTNAGIDCYAEIKLYDKNGQTSLDVSKEVKGKNVVVKWKCPKDADGSYYVSLKNSEPANDATAYDINIFPIDIYEDDNNRYQARVILMNQSEHHSFHKVDDKDWIMFYATAGKDYTINVTNVGTGCDPQINIYNDSSIDPFVTRNRYEIGKAETITWNFDRDAYYYVEIINMAAGSGNSTWYDISISRDVGPEFPGAIIGMVFDASRFPRKPILGAKIQVSGLIDVFKSSNGRDANGIYYPGLVGSYITPAINAGDYTITATARDYQPYQSSSTVHVYGASITEHIINMVPTPLAKECTYCIDNDGDGRGDWETENHLMDGDEENSSLTLPSPYVENCEDCDDSNDSAFLGAPEICDNGIDDNCNGAIDEKHSYYPDKDGDGYGDSNASPEERCFATSSYSLINTDCDDNDSSVNPHAPENCGNGKDDDCDGKIDEQDEDCVCTDKYTYYRDADGDKFGDQNEAKSINSCNSQAPNGYVNDHTDCNDSDASINPNMSEICNNGRDDDCDNKTDSDDEGCPVTTTTSSTTSTTVPTTTTTTTVPTTMTSTSTSTTVPTTITSTTLPTTTSSSTTSTTAPTTTSTSTSTTVPTTATSTTVPTTTSSSTTTTVPTTTSTSTSTTVPTTATSTTVPTTTSSSTTTTAPTTTSTSTSTTVPTTTTSTTVPTTTSSSTTTTVPTTTTSSTTTTVPTTTSTSTTVPPTTSTTVAPTTTTSSTTSTTVPTTTISSTSSTTVPVTTTTTICGYNRQTDEGFLLYNAVSILQALTGMDVKCWSDTNGDRKASLDDVILILRKATGWRE